MTTAILSPASIRAVDGIRRIVEKYKQEGWGIYDDSTDIDRVVVLSDAYYGDASSVVKLCRKRGMPIMIQNVDI